MLRLDDCIHCGCFTDLVGYSRETAIEALENGHLGCENCIEDQEEDPDFHTACVVLYDGEEAIWQGGCHPTEDPFATEGSPGEACQGSEEG